MTITPSSTSKLSHGIVQGHALDPDNCRPDVSETSESIASKEGLPVDLKTAPAVPDTADVDTVAPYAVAHVSPDEKSAVETHLDGQTATSSKEPAVAPSLQATTQTEDDASQVCIPRDATALILQLIHHCSFPSGFGE